MPFIREYARYMRDLNLRSWTADWARHFGEEIVKSPVNQVSLVLGVAGIAGVIIAFFNFIIAHPLVPLLAFACGLVVLVLLSMFSFQTSRRAAVSLTNDTRDETERLLRRLDEKGRMTTAAIRESLGITAERARDLAEKAKEQGWIEQWSGTWKITEAMKPIVRRQLREKREE